jgi:hypothetical protein
MPSNFAILKCTCWFYCIFLSRQSCHLQINAALSLPNLCIFIFILCLTTFALTLLVILEKC